MAREPITNQMASLYRTLAHSNHPIGRLARRVHRAIDRFTLPAPRMIVWPILQVFLFVREVYWFLKRVLICEPLFKAYCTSYGRNVRTGVFVHYVFGRGDIVLGNDVKVDGKCGFSFSRRYTDHPTLVIGDHTTIAHDCSFTVAKSITIGRHCMIASGVWMFDSNGHPTDPAARLAGLPPPEHEVKPIVVGDNVWIGRHCYIFPGVTIGENSIVSAGSVVMTDVPPNTIVAGYPARRVNLQPMAAPKAAGAAAAESGAPSPVPTPAVS